MSQPRHAALGSGAATLKNEHVALDCDCHDSMIARHRHQSRVTALLDQFPVVAILGARQVGKTTLARKIAAGADGPTVHFDLEGSDDLARLDEPRLALQRLQGLVVIDEIQRRPDLFPILRVLVDRAENRARFLILGSAAPELLRQTSESLAGRITYHELPGFALDEVGLDAWDRLWWRGGFPRSFLAPSDESSVEWRRSFVRTFLERDIPQLGSQIPAVALHRFWRMLAHYHAQVWSSAELARAFGVAATTVRRYLDLLTGALVVHQLQPWHENISKRQVRSPKVYVDDPGLLHALLGIGSRESLESHPKVGASWEGFVFREVVACLGTTFREGQRRQPDASASRSRSVRATGSQRDALDNAALVGAIDPTEGGDALGRAVAAAVGSDLRAAPGWAGGP